MAEPEKPKKLDEPKEEEVEGVEVPVGGPHPPMEPKEEAPAVYEREGR